MNVALRPGHLDILSLCTGGAGLDLGVELAFPGARTVCMVEREAFAVAHLVSAMRQGLLHPASVWSDARTFDGRAWRGCVDGLIGGIPCQPHSLSGKRLGEDDERDLWSTARRIIVQSGAWFVLIENVGGMLSSGGAERVWRDLRRLGFAVEGGLFTAAEVGASHERERLFLLAVADDRCERAAAGFPAAAGWEGLGAEPAIADHGGDAVADTEGERLEGQRANAGAGRRQDARRPAGLRDGADMAEAVDDAVGAGRPARRQDHRGDVGDVLGAAGQHPVVDAARLGRRKGRAEPELSERDGPAVDVAGAPLADTARHGKRPVAERQSGADEAHADADWAGLFPPGPSDLAAWVAIVEHAADRLPALSRHDRFRLALRAAHAAVDGDPGARQGLDPLGPYGLRAAVVQELAQSHLRGLADGLAAKVDRLRMLGNGVVSLEAAYAVRTLATRLAGRGSTGAARLVRMMGAA